MKKLIPLLACLVATFSLFAQSDRGSITGTIVDSSGALIPGAKITLTNSATGFKSDSVSTGTGNYTLAGLPAGSYSLTNSKSNGMYGLSY